MFRIRRHWHWRWISCMFAWCVASPDTIWTHRHTHRPFTCEHDKWFQCHRRRLMRSETNIATYWLQKMTKIVFAQPLISLTLRICRRIEWHVANENVLVLCRSLGVYQFDGVNVISIKSTRTLWYVRKFHTGTVATISSGAITWWAKCVTNSATVTLDRVNK